MARPNSSFWTYGAGYGKVLFGLAKEDVDGVQFVLVRNDSLPVGLTTAPYMATAVQNTVPYGVDRTVTGPVLAKPRPQNTVKYGLNYAVAV
jgi:hypothetical protein